MTYKMKKILHVAAFEGNVGDNASHLGFNKILDLLGINVIIDRLEIRKTYNNYKGSDKIYFDDTFVVLANQYDYVIFGGGGFLDYWVENSINGTTINISNDILKKITTKILITSIGSNPHRKIPEGNIEKYKNFLNYVRNSNNIKIALRNDGSLESIRNDLGYQYSDIFFNILDHGFFYIPSNIVSLPIKEKFLCINITADQIEMYNDGKIAINDKRAYLTELSELVQEIINTYKLKVVFTPHIFSDLNAITEVLDLLPDYYKRSEVIVAPLLQGDIGTDYLFNLYSNSEFVIASRYHANVCSINQNKKVIGLSPLQRIEYIHEQFSLSNSYVEISPGFKNKVLSLMNSNIKFDTHKIENLKRNTLNFYKNYFFD